MKTNILNLYLRISLKIVGIWPGNTRVWSVVLLASLGLFFVYFSFVYFAENIHDIDAVSENVVGNIGNLYTVIQIIILRFKRR